MWEKALDQFNDKLKDQNEQLKSRSPSPSDIEKNTFKKAENKLTEHDSQKTKDIFNQKLSQLKQPNNHAKSPMKEAEIFKSPPQKLEEEIEIKPIKKNQGGLFKISEEPTDGFKEAE
jgi:Mn-containing catalase